MPLVKRVLLLFIPLLFLGAGKTFAACETTSPTHYVLSNNDVNLTITFKNTGDTPVFWIEIPTYYSNAIIYLTAQTLQESGWSLDSSSSDYFIYTSPDGLAPGDSVHFDVTIHTADDRVTSLSWQASADPSGAPAEDCSALNLEVTSNPPQPPVLSSTRLSIGNTSATLNWTTDVTATGLVNYGTTTAYGSTTTTPLGTSHSASLSGLSASTTYHYQIQVTGDGGIVTTNDNTFTTAAPDITTTLTTTVTVTNTNINTITNTVVEILKDTVPPVVSLKTDFSKPFKEAPTITGISTDGGAVNAGVVSLEYSLDGGKNWLPVDTIDNPGKKSTTFSFTPGKLDDGNYLIKVRAKDATGNTGLSKLYTLVFDRLPPMVGGSLFSLGPMILNPDTAGRLFTLTGLPLKITLSAVGGPLTMTLSYNTQKFSLIKNIDSGLWSGTINISSPGTYQTLVNSIDGAQNVTNRQLNTVIALAPGTITDSQHHPLTAAQISVYIFNQTENDFVLFDASPYLQVNPQPTDADGHYRLILPAGKYYLEITAPGQRKQRTTIFNIASPTPITQNFSLTPSFFFANWWAQTVPFQSTNIPSDSISANSLVGQPLPDFDLSTADFAFSNTTILGKPTVITFITSWEPQTSDQLLALDRFQATNPGINIVAVAVQESVSKVSIFQKTGGYTTPIVADPDGILVLPLSLQSLPTHLIIDKKGIIKEVIVGYTDENSLLNSVLN